MTVSLPFVFVLAVVAWVAVKALHIRPWLVVVLVLLGFYLQGTFLGPAIDSGTRTGVDVVNETGK
ncbi:hypothetical protein HRW16_23235 [Streptomyces lunaelactis]|uniref:hypothetical protein n=1 Tax=Streptomyces lunaelactis TaxID=1535768 RepID=UPI0015849318|nr:hypothetical protein [Streptomyces lunaelactis]NUK37321.1 hypothetical protein [Streptomyces lunaelactis]NUK43359.1 hypothetical protein [Streptomyces lunaelactis]NUK94693.1 hypothetical protein [Streptomyces lunaelactis]NUL33540.1 hypothetical protein [Streptomyces lunaelactis]